MSISPLKITRKSDRNLYCNPEQGKQSFLENLNPGSLEKLGSCKLEKSLESAGPEKVFQFATLGQISEDVVRDVDVALKRELSGAVGPDGKAGGLAVLVDIINGVDKSTEDAVMANDIRNLMFVFEDLTRIDDTAMREILKKVEGQQLTYALKTATDEMKEKIFSNLSLRAGEMLKDDLDAMGPIRLTEVEKAQQAVIRAAKELEADGTITLGKGKDDVLV
jgi:flagellar motor switch protein FliG